MMNDLTPEMGRRRQAAWGAYKSIEDVVKKTRNTRLRAHLFNATVLPALTYVRKPGLFANRKKTRGPSSLFWLCTEKTSTPPCSTGSEDVVRVNAEEVTWPKADVLDWGGERGPEDNRRG
ncbi:hypothetical protein RB195_024473 [Necator americanus]